MTGWDSYWATGTTDERWLKVDPQVTALTPRMWEQGKRRALDFGCGVGRHTVFLAGQGFQTYACDPSPQAVAACRRWLRHEGLRARVKAAPTNTVPYPNGYLHWAIAFNVVYHNTLAGMEALIGGLRRVIAKGGYLFLTLQSTRSYKYGEGEEIEPGTFVNTRDVLEHERAVLHHYSGEGEVSRIARGWEVVEAREMADSYSASGGTGAPIAPIANSSYHWYLLLRRPGPHPR